MKIETIKLILPFISIFLSCSLTWFIAKRKFKITEDQSQTKNINNIFKMISNFVSFSKLREALRDQKENCDRLTKLQIDKHDSDINTFITHVKQYRKEVNKERSSLKKEVRKDREELTKERNEFRLVVITATGDMKKYTENMAIMHGNILNRIDDL